MKSKATLRLSILSFLFLLNIASGRVAAQCNNWSASAALTAASFCAANGTFTVTLNGPDVANLTNIQYGIPISANGFSVPLNSSPNFSSIPPGTYQVSVIADCGGVPVGRNTTIVVPGKYTPPIWNSAWSTTRPSFNCAPTGWIRAYVDGGVAPFTFTLVSYPSSYTGPKTATSAMYFYQFDNLPPGSYSIQVSDACQSGTVPASMTVASLNPASAPITAGFITTRGCDTIIIQPPNLSGSPWNLYYYDTAFKFSMKISSGILAQTAPLSWSNTYLTLKLPVGKSIKDLYGDTISYNVIPTCGSTFTIKPIIQTAGLTVGVNLRCDTDFIATLSAFPYICYPVTYTLKNTATNVSYGPFIASKAQAVTTPPLPLGTYLASFTTADGFSGSRTITAATVSRTKPFTVQVWNGAPGMNNYAYGFYFYDSSVNSGGAKTVELFSGPAGYSYSGQWSSGLRDFSVQINGSPTPSTLRFPAGNYVWKITDDCGVYYLPITVTAADLYQFTVGAPAQRLTCQGLWIWPNGTASNNGTSKNVRFFLYLNGAPHYIQTPTGGTTWPLYSANSPILLTTPGTYTIVACETGATPGLAGFFNPGGFYLGFPNIYTSSYSFTYTPQPLSFDINKTQGFLCKGASPGQGQIYAAAKGGIMLPTPSPHYDYYLSLPGNALSGPYIASNSTGIFTGFGANANGLYDVKVVDSCGAFAVQQVKILDLGTARLISSSHYSACIGNNIQLSAIYLPNATYSWTGPAGFTSTLRQPVIANAGPLNAGVYRVTINTSICNQAISDSTIIVINPNPPKPLVSYTCQPRPVVLSITNPAAGSIYKWDIGRVTAYYGPVFVHDTLQNSDTLLTKKVLYTGSFAPVAIDTLTGCNTKGDSLVFLSNPLDSLKASIYSPHLQICSGDSTILVAKWTSGALSPAFQWFRNGSPVSGANGMTYTAKLGGQYSVLVDGGPCNTDTSAAVTVSVVSPPVATLTTLKDSICQGDTAMLQASTGTGYSYVWHRNGSVIPGAYAAAYPATLAGNYFVMITNGACFTNSAVLPLAVIASPNVVLNPSTPQTICAGSIVSFSTTPDTSFTYSWSRNGTIIPGATSDTFSTKQDGSYRVIVATAQCPHTASPAVSVTVLPSTLSLGNDTLICSDLSFPVPLSIDTGFTQILWSTGDTGRQIKAPGGGQYWVTARNSCGLFTDTMRIFTKTDYDPGLPSDTLVCNTTGVARLSVPQFLQNVTWSTGANGLSITIDTPGTYWMEASSPCGVVRDTIRVQYCAPDIHEFRLSADSICEGDCITFASTVYYAKSYQWTFEGGNPSASKEAVPGTVCYPKAGIYSVKLIVQNKGGGDTAESVVVVSAMPVTRFKDTLLHVPYKTSITLPACAYAQKVDWYKGDSLICSNCQVLQIDARYYQNTYRCVVSNGDCPDTCNYSLRVIDIPRDVWLPDAFTPNNDGLNDYFRVITDNPNIEVLNLAVFNRWGQNVFSSNRSRNGWEGKFRGMPAEGGTYFWQLSYRLLGEQESILKKGDVLLIR